MSATPIARADGNHPRPPRSLSRLRSLPTTAKVAVVIAVYLSIYGVGLAILHSRGYGVRDHRMLVVGLPLLLVLTLFGWFIQRGTWRRESAWPTGDGDPMGAMNRVTTWSLRILFIAGIAVFPLTWFEEIVRGRFSPTLVFAAATAILAAFAEESVLRRWVLDRALNGPIGPECAGRTAAITGMSVAGSMLVHLVAIAGGAPVPAAVALALTAAFAAIASAAIYLTTPSFGSLVAWHSARNYLGTGVGAGTLITGQVANAALQLSLIGALGGLLWWALAVRGPLKKEPPLV